ncbi:MAG: VRR-NUC domain-containing protein [Magnetococcus sp. WYHC-3]
MKKLLEKEIQHQIISYLELKKYLVVKINNVGIRKENGAFIPPRQKGVSDLICCKDGQFIAIEVKSDSGRISEAQTAFLDEVEDRGGKSYVLRSLDEAMKVL